MADDDVQLTDLEVIQRYSLAVRGATASRSELVAALQSDLDWLTGGRRASPGEAPEPAARTRPARATAKGPAKATAKAPAKAPARSPRATSAKRTAPE